MKLDGHAYLNLFHIFLVVPFFLWVGIARANLPIPVFWVLVGLGILLAIYHGYKAVIRYMNESPMIWVNLIHALWVGPLLFYIGFNKKDTPRPAYELLLLTAFGALGYHLYEFAQYAT